MKSFADSTNQLWQIEINVTAVKRVRGLLNIDLYKLLEDGCKPLAALISDPVQLCDVLFVLCKDQAEKEQVSDEDFGRRMGGDSLLAGANAFYEELIDFFPEARARASMRQVAEKGKIVQARLLDHLQSKVTELDADKAATELIANLESAAKKLRPSSGTAPEFSDSTPDPLLSASYSS